MPSLGKIKAIFDPLKFVTVKGLAEPKVTVFVIFAFSGLQRMFLSNFIHAVCGVNSLSRTFGWPVKHFLLR